MRPSLHNSLSTAGLQDSLLGSLLVSLLAGLASCAAPGSGSVDHHIVHGDRPTGLTSRPVEVLGPDIDALQEAFNANDDRPRLIALMSPTCPRCADSADIIRRAIDNAPEGVDPCVIVVWLEVFAIDDEEACQDAMQRFAGTATRGFVDDLRIAGRLLTRGRLPIGIARHLFLWYEPGPRWEDAPPSPTGWGHQLRRHDPTTYCPSDVLEERLTSVFGRTDS